MDFFFFFYINKVTKTVEIQDTFWGDLFQHVIAQSLYFLITPESWLLYYTLTFRSTCTVSTSLSIAFAYYYIQLKNRHVDILD